MRLAELFGAGVLTDLKVGAAFPTNHPLHVAAPSVLLTRDGDYNVALRDHGHFGLLYHPQPYAVATESLTDLSSHAAAS